MKLLADQAIPGIKSLFTTDDMDCQQLPAEQINAAALENVDILWVRSVTKVAPALLANSAVRFVGSCTIGVDHIDLEYLQQQDIAFAHAPGCNAVAVSEYVLQSIARYAVELDLKWSQLCVGIIGWGNVGHAVSGLLDALQIDYRVYDPPLQAISSRSPKNGWASLDETLAANVITLHVPLTTSTRQLLNAEQLQKISPLSLIINTSRGEVLDEVALFEHFSPAHFYLAMDVFSQEPAIDSRWLCYAWQMTPHIAGHSERGKWRGSEMVYDALQTWLKTQGKHLAERHQDYAPPLQQIDFAGSEINAPILYQLIQQVFDLSETDKALRKVIAQRLPIADVFRQARADYIPRREFRDCMLASKEPHALLSRLGFQDLIQS
jgi:erythronate-4-phosphate dehydrogenase